MEYINTLLGFLKVGGIRGVICNPHVPTNNKPITCFEPVTGRGHSGGQSPPMARSLCIPLLILH